MHWRSRRITAVTGIIRAGESREAPGVPAPEIGWQLTEDCDRVVLRLDDYYVCTVPVTEIQQHAEEAQQLRRLVEIALTCTGAGHCHGKLHWCEGCEREVLDVCDIGVTCPHHGEEATKQRIERAIAWINSLDDIHAINDPDKKDAE